MSMVPFEEPAPPLPAQTATPWAVVVKPSSTKFPDDGGDWATVVQLPPWSKVASRDEEPDDGFGIPMTIVPDAGGVAINETPCCPGAMPDAIRWNVVPPSLDS
jgi:hypothetical protein